MPEIGSWFNDICEQQNRVDEILKLVQKSCSTGYLSLYLDTSDVIKEGHYVNVDTNVKATFLPWAFSIPKNTGSDRTAVAIDVTLGAQPYVSAVEDYLDCFACTIRTNFSARIYGACHSSFVGRWINGYDKVSANTAS